MAGFLGAAPWLKKLLVACHILPLQQAKIPWGRGVLRLNLRKPLPFDENVFRVIYCLHTLEHLYFDEAQRLLKECCCVLQRGGVCRFVVPDLASTVASYTASKQRGEVAAADSLIRELRMHDEAPPRGLLAWYYRLTAFHQHKWMYDGESLQRLFHAAGFAKARAVVYLENQIERINEVEDPDRILDDQGIVVEGIKE